MGRTTEKNNLALSLSILGFSLLKLLACVLYFLFEYFVSSSVFYYSYLVVEAERSPRVDTRLFRMSERASHYDIAQRIADRSPQVGRFHVFLFASLTPRHDSRESPL